MSEDAPAGKEGRATPTIALSQCDPSLSLVPVDLENRCGAEILTVISISP